MRLDSEGLRELYQRETSRSARGSAADCLTADMLARAAAGELNQSEREQTADHLVTCSDCAQDYRAVVSLKSWAGAAAADARVVPLQASGNGRSHLLPVEPTVHDVRIGSRRVSFYLPYTIAAASVILSFALGALLISRWRENQRLAAEINRTQLVRKAEDEKALVESRRLLEEANRRAEQESAARRAAEEELARREAVARSSSRPQSSSSSRLAPDVNVPIVDLNPQDAGRGEENQKATTIQLPPGTDLFTLILNLSGDDASRSYSLEVTDRSNHAIWTNRELRKSPYNNFTVALHRGSFPAGEYRLKIYGLRDGKRQLIEEYAIRLVY